ncbi:MAG: glycosyltransferase family 4 protein [Endomicrobiia bacterium]
MVNSIKAINGPWEKCIVVPYGVPQPSFIQIKQRKNNSFNKPLNILTVGTVCLRKGIQYILQAAEELIGKCEFTIIGNKPYKFKKTINIPPNVKLLPHTPNLNLYYEKADIFLLPSLAEGSALACYEALQYGLPLIVTPNTGMFIENGVHGFEIPIKSSNAIVEAIEKFLKQPELLETFSTSALQLSQYASYNAYKQRLNDLLLKNFI